MEPAGVGTKAQQALQLMREQTKNQRKTESRRQRLAEKQRRFELKQLKRKQKHRGRQLLCFFVDLLKVCRQFWQILQADFIDIIERTRKWIWKRKEF